MFSADICVGPKTNNLQRKVTPHRQEPVRGLGLKESYKATGAHGGSYFERQKEKSKERENRKKRKLEKKTRIWNKAPF